MWDGATVIGLVSKTKIRSNKHCCCCCCCLHIKSRSGLYSVLSNIRTGPTDANAFRGHRLTTQKGYTCVRFLHFKPRLIRQTYTERCRLAPEYMGSNKYTPTHTADDSYKYHRTRVRSDSYTIFYLNRHNTPSGQFRVYRVIISHAIAYRWRSLPRVRRHRVRKPQGSSKRVLRWQVTMDQLICVSLSHNHYWYKVGMLKVTAMRSRRCV